MKKVVRDGKVAVIYSPGYGAGWSTWVDDSEAAVFDPEIVEWIESGKNPKQEKQFERYGYTGGLDDAVIKWIPEGTAFRIGEYDGHEFVVIYSADDYYVA